MDEGIWRTVALQLNNLAQTLYRTNRLSDAEPLMHRALAIAILFQRQNGHEHSSYQGRLDRYIELLIGMGLDEDEIERRVKSAHEN